MSNTYFLAPFLPPVHLGQKNPIEMGALDALLKSQLNEKDFGYFTLLKLRHELEGLRHSAFKAEGRPDFIREWLERHATAELHTTHFQELLEGFYEFVEREKNPFLIAYFQLEREIGEQFLSLRKRDKSLSSPEWAIKLYEKGPMLLEKGLIEYKFRKIDEWVGLNVFSSDAILAYAAKFYLNEEVLKWDREKGDKLLDILEKGML